MASFKNPPPRRLRGIVHYLLLLFQPGGGGDDYGSRCSLCRGRLNEVLMRSISRAVSSFAIVSSVRFSEPLRRRDTYCCVQPILSASAFCVSPVSCIFSRTRSRSQIRQSSWPSSSAPLRRCFPSSRCWCLMPLYYVDCICHISSWFISMKLSRS